MLKKPLKRKKLRKVGVISVVVIQGNNFLCLDEKKLWDLFLYILSFLFWEVAFYGGTTCGFSINKNIFRRKILGYLSEFHLERIGKIFTWKLYVVGVWFHFWSELGPVDVNGCRYSTSFYFIISTNFLWLSANTNFFLSERKVSHSFDVTSERIGILGKIPGISSSPHCVPIKRVNV